MDFKEIIFSFFNDFFIILGEMAPYLLLGFFFAGLLHAFMPRQSIEKYFNGKTIRSSVNAALFGIPLPLCSCGVIPTGMAFYKNGASKGGTISFLISTPQTGVDSILATFSLMGLPLAIIRPIAALVTGITGGYITSKITKKDPIQVAQLQKKSEKKSIRQKLEDVFKYGFVEFIQDISKWLVIGLVLAAVISVLVPNQFAEILNLPPILQMLLILIVSIPFYICATGSIPLAAVLILKGFSPGAAFVLLMAGPATNAATITMIAKVMGRKSLIAYLSSIIIGALGFGLLIDYVLPMEWFLQITHQEMAHDHMQQIEWWQLTSGIILLGLIINGYIQKFINSKKLNHMQTSKNESKSVSFSIEGMTCNHCKSNVETNVANLPFVKNATAILSENKLIVEGEDIDMEKVKETVESIGYKVL